MNKLLSIGLGAFLATSAIHGVALNPVAPFTPLYSAYSATLNDNFYTIDPSQLSTAINVHGYADTGIVGYVEKTLQPNTAAFRRFYKGPPQTDHFYTTSSAEEATVLGYGWIFERFEGYLYTTQVPGSIPLYRVNRFTPATGDQVHKYTTSYTEVTNLVAAGWKLDTTAGYLYPQAFPSVTGGWVFGLRCPSDRFPCNSGNGGNLNFRDYYFPMLAPPSTTKPLGRTRQKVSFRFRSPNFFGLTADGKNAGHLFFGAHGQFNAYTPAIDSLCAQGTPLANCTWHRGAGFFLYSDGCPPALCGSSRQFSPELFWVTGNQFHLPYYWTFVTLQNDQDYAADLVVGDDGLMTVKITNAATGVLIFDVALYVASEFPKLSPFPSELTGYFLGSGTDASRDFTFYVTNLQVTWLP